MMSEEIVAKVMGILYPLHAPFYMHPQAGNLLIMYCFIFIELLMSFQKTS